MRVRFLVDNELNSHGSYRRRVLCYAWEWKSSIHRIVLVRAHLVSSLLQSDVELRRTETERERGERVYKIRRARLRAIYLRLLANSAGSWRRTTIDMMQTAFRYRLGSLCSGLDGDLAIDHHRRQVKQNLGR